MANIKKKVVSTKAVKTKKISSKKELYEHDETRDLEEKENKSEKKELLSLRHVDVKFNVRGRILNAIRDVTMNIYEGETLAIVGESGSGKSVLTKTFSGMLDSNGYISHGRITFKSDELSKTDAILSPKTIIKRDKIYNLLNEYSYAEGFGELYDKITSLEEEYESIKHLSLEDKEKLDKELEEANYDYIEAVNVLLSINKKVEKEDYIAKKNQVNELKKIKEDVEKKIIETEKKHKEELKQNIALHEEYQSKINKLKEERNALIEKAKEKPLSKEILDRNMTLANEIILSTDRYNYIFKNYCINKLVRGYQLMMNRGKPLDGPKYRNRVYDGVTFRVKHVGTTTIESNKIKRDIEEVFAKEIVKDNIDYPDLFNDTLVLQAISLHPYLKYYLTKKIAKYSAEFNSDLNNINKNIRYFDEGFDMNKENHSQRLADIILLKVLPFDSTIHAWYYALKVLKWIKSAYESKLKDLSSHMESKPIEQLNGFALIDCAQVKTTKDWQKIRGCQIATVFQDPMTSLNPILTIGKQIMIVIQKHQKCSKNEAKRRALSIMEKVGIPDPIKRFDDYPFQYSGGMRQRIVIAIALSCQPKVLICDEPTTALDVTIQAQIIRLIKKLSADLGFTTVYITHDLGVVANVADRVAVLYGGQVVEIGSVEDIFFDPRHPYTWALLSSLPQLSTKGDDLFSISGTPPSLYNKIVGDAFAPRSEYAMAIDFVKEPPMFEINSHHSAKTWLLDPRSPKIQKPEIIQNLHEKMTKIYASGGKK